MANLLEQIGQGLRSGLRVAGAGLSPRVYESQEREREQFEQIKARRDEMLMQATIQAVENGSLAPEKAQRLAQAKGWQLPSLGPSIQTQKTQSDIGIEANRRNFREQARAKWFSGPETEQRPVGTDMTIGPDGAHVSPVEVDRPAPITERQTNYANELIQSGDPELQKEGLGILKGIKEKAESVSPLKRLQQERAQAIQTYGEDHPIVRQFDLAIAQQTQGQQRNVQFEEFATGKTIGGKPEFQKFRVNADGSLSKEGGPYIKGALVDVTVGGMTPENAAKTELLNQGISDMAEFKAMLMPDGKVDRSLVLALSAPGFAGAPGTDARIAYSLIYNAIEAKLRAESGAAVPETEVQRMAARFIPSPLDNDEAIRSKVRRMEAFLRGSFQRIKGAGEPRTEAAPSGDGGWTSEDEKRLQELERKRAP